MLNIDKYREDILEEIKTRETANKENDNENSSGLVYFDSIEAVRRKHGGGSSLYFSDDVKWLFTEYEPPLLENGDGLKPGDWIMVKHYKHDTWKKRKFLCYWNGRFFATKGYWEATSFKDFNSYTIARLPEEGE